jgi:hypothetical protein
VTGTHLSRFAYILHALKHQREYGPIHDTMQLISQSLKDRVRSL